MTESSTQNQGCLSVILRLFGIKKTDSGETDTSLPYRVRDDFLSPAELSFFLILQDVVGSKAVICTKVNLADIFYVARPNENYSYRNRIAHKHLDYLLCEPKTMQPILGIELDDASHNRQDRQERDQFVNDVFRTAGLPLIHFNAQLSYNTNELASQLDLYLEKSLMSPATNHPERSVSVPAGSGIPFCSKCGIQMVLRTAARGENQGKQFYGCPNYPKCREILPIE